MPVSEFDGQHERFTRFLGERGLKVTRQRHVIADVFFRSGRHLSLLELLELVRLEQPSVGYATVYRTMRLLSECGLAAEHRFAEKNSSFEPRVDGEHHDHLICTQCGRIIEYEDDRIERLQEELAAQLGFRVVGHRHELYGECLAKDCAWRVGEGRR